MRNNDVIVEPPFAKPATPESLKSLSKNMLQTIDSLYHEMYVDMVIMEAFRRGILEGVVDDRDYTEKVVCVHANICCAMLSLCVQCRASIGAQLNVEKQYNIKRSIVTCHEVYKYLYGFTGKMTLWKQIEPVLQAKHPSEILEIKAASALYLQQYAQNADGTKRDVSKHFSNNPVEFYKNISSISERDESDRIVKAMAFLQPMHSILIKELQEKFGVIYYTAMNQPMPRQIFIPVGIRPGVIEDLSRGLQRFESIVENLMSQIESAEKICTHFNLDLTNAKQWSDITENNVGLHILYAYLDSMTAFMAFCRSEDFVEYRQNLAYLVMSAHEGLKKLYGFDANQRVDSFWNRAIQNVVSQTGDEQLSEEADLIESKLDTLSKNAFLGDEKLATVFSHIGAIKKYKTETPFAVLECFRTVVRKEDLDVLTDYLHTLNDVILLYNKVMSLEKNQIAKENAAKFSRYLKQICSIDELVKQKTKDPTVLSKLKEISEKFKGLINSFDKYLD